MSPEIPHNEWTAGLQISVLYRWASFRCLTKTAGEEKCWARGAFSLSRPELSWNFTDRKRDATKWKVCCRLAGVGVNSLENEAINSKTPTQCFHALFRIVFSLLRHVARVDRRELYDRGIPLELSSLIFFTEAKNSENIFLLILRMSPRILLTEILLAVLSPSINKNWIKRP